MSRRDGLPIPRHPCCPCGLAVAHDGPCQPRQRQRESEYVRAVREARRAILVAALTQAHGRRGVAARALGLNRTYLQRLIHEFGIQVPAPLGRPPQAATRLACGHTRTQHATLSGAAGWTRACDAAVGNPQEATR